MDTKSSHLITKIGEMSISGQSNEQSDLRSTEFDSACVDCDTGSGHTTASAVHQQPRTSRPPTQSLSKTVLQSTNTDSGFCECTGRTSSAASSSPSSINSKSRHLESRIVNRFDAKYDQESTKWFLQDSDGENDLMIAITHPESTAHRQIVQIICDNARELRYLNLRNKRGLTAVYFAALCRNLPALHRLRLAGADANIADYLGNTAVHLAAARGDSELLKALVQEMKEDELQQYSQVYRKVLPERAKQSVSQKVEVNARNCDGKTPIYLAVERGHVEVLDLLITYGANPNLKENSAGYTPLHAAVEQRQVQCLEKLVQSSKLEVNERTYAGLTALDLAERLPQPTKDKVVDLLNPLQPEHGDVDSEDCSSSDDEMDDEPCDANDSFSEEM